MSIKLKTFLLSTCSGLLLWIAWPTLPTTFVIFFAFAPLLYAEHEFTTAGKKGFWIFSYWTFLLWNACTTWWIWYASDGGSYFAIAANAALMTVPIAAFRKTRDVFGPRLGYLSLIVYWLGFEYLHLNWDISWPWLTLGNVFAVKHTWVQWYEYTGILGGSFWVLLVNIVITKLAIQNNKNYVNALIKVLAVIMIPMFFSYWVGSSAKEDGKSIKVVSVQPNIDPYGEKFDMPVEIQIEMLEALTEKALNEGPVDIVLWPETAIQGSNRESTFIDSERYQSVSNILKRHAGLSILSGLECWEKVPEDSNPAFTKYSKHIGAYQTYNAGLWLNGDTTAIYHKSKFVPGAESIPFPDILFFFEDLVDFSAGGSYAPQSTRPVFKTKNNIAVAPVICYESIYGDFLSPYIQKGADFIAIITNDGWWEDTEGHRQHCAYAKLRAIEFRKPVVRSANTGISCFIDITGNMTQATDWWVPTVISGEVKSSKKLTFYAQHGDYLGRTFSFLAIVLFISTLVRKKTEKYR